VSALGQTLQVLRGQASGEVSFRPRTDLIPMRDLMAHAYRLPNQAEEHAMQNQIDAVRPVPWNKGKLAAAKPPLRPKHVWSIRTKLQIEGRIRDLAMFNLAIDSKLRGCDVVALRVDDVAAGGYTADCATVRQKKPDGPLDLN
jgi:hypothetical protein